MNTQNARLNTGELALDTYRHYNTTFKHFQTFVNQEIKRKDLQLREIVPSMIDNFFLFLKSDLKLKHNTALLFMYKLKTVLATAFRDGIIDRNPMLNFKARTEKTEIEFLTEKNMDKIRNITLDNRLEQTRDLFVFACYTGLSHVDLMSFDAKKDLKIDSKGNGFIAKKRQKTNVESIIPLLPVVKAVLEKYNSELPKMTRQKYNLQLKRLQALCGIETNMHSHIARHTLATGF